MEASGHIYIFELFLKLESKKEKKLGRTMNTEQYCMLTLTFAVAVLGV
jgi:hypothetical protein